MASRAIPTSVKVFGIMDLVLGSFAAISAVNTLVNFFKVQQVLPAGLSQFVSPTPFEMVLGVIMPIALLTLGIGLLKRQPWARKFSIYFAIFVITVGLLHLASTVAHFAGANNPMVIGIIAGTLFGAVLGAIYYGLMIYFLSRPEVKAAMD